MGSAGKKIKENDEDEEEGNDDEEDDEYDEDEDEGNQANKPPRKVQKKLRSYPFITDLEQWKKKQRLPPETKVYIIMGGYPDLKTSLKSRGWVGNPDLYSPCFDMKWTLRPSDIDFNNLKDF